MIPRLGIAENFLIFFFFEKVKKILKCLKCSMVVAHRDKKNDPVENDLGVLAGS